MRHESRAVGRWPVSHASIRQSLAGSAIAISFFRRTLEIFSVHARAQCIRQVRRPPAGDSVRQENPQRHLRDGAGRLQPAATRAACAAQRAPGALLLSGLGRRDQRDIRDPRDEELDASEGRACCQADPDSRRVRPWAEAEAVKPPTNQFVGGTLGSPARASGGCPFWSFARGGRMIRLLEDQLRGPAFLARLGERATQALRPRT
jgi:hypothetical protein